MLGTDIIECIEKCCASLQQPGQKNVVHRYNRVDRKILCIHTMDWPKKVRRYSRLKRKIPRIDTIVWIFKMFYIGTIDWKEMILCIDIIDQRGKCCVSLQQTGWNTTLHCYNRLDRKMPCIATINRLARIMLYTNIKE